MIKQWTTLDHNDDSTWPEPDVDVLVCWRGGVLDGSVDVACRGSNGIWETHFDYGYDDEDIYGWLPLPDEVDNDPLQADIERALREKLSQERLSEKKLQEIHAEIMRLTQQFRIRQEKLPKIWISRELFNRVFDSSLGDHFSGRVNSPLMYFGCPCNIVDGWAGVRYIVGFEGGCSL